MSAPRLACVDVGSNTVTLVVAEQAPTGEWRPVHQEAVVTRLGEGLDARGRLGDAALRRTVDVLSRMSREVRALGAPGLVGVATAAAREAANGDALLHAADRAGARLTIISGDEEAGLSWRAAWHDLGEPDRPLVVVDVGGRSTEIIGGSGPELQVRTSRPVGAVRLTEACVRADPPGEAGRRCVHEQADAAFAELPASLERLAAHAPAPRLVAVAGTATTLAAVRLRLDRYDPDRVHGSEVDLTELETLGDGLWQLTLEARRALPGMEPGRADVLPAGAVILARAARRLGARRITVSDRGVRWGLLYALAAQSAYIP